VSLCIRTLEMEKSDFWLLSFWILNCKTLRKKKPQSHHRNRIAILRAQYISRTIARIKETIPVVEKVYIYTSWSPALAGIINIPTRYAAFLLLLFFFFSGRWWPWNYRRPIRIHLNSVIILSYQFTINYRSPAASANIAWGEGFISWIVDLY